MLIEIVVTHSAVSLAKVIREQTGKKSNSCLVNWHVVNLAICVLMLVVTVILFFQGTSQEEGKESDNFSVMLFAFIAFRFYVDLFLLTLLFRFTRPLKTVKAGVTEAQAILFQIKIKNDKKENDDKN